MISGEEATQEENEKKEDLDQIDSKQPNTFDQIDPLFMSALNEPSIQAIKENDKLIK
jgi:hypothetical protein